MYSAPHMLFSVDRQGSRWERKQHLKTEGLVGMGSLIKLDWWRLKMRNEYNQAKNICKGKARVRCLEHSLFYVLANTQTVGDRVTCLFNYFPCTMYFTLRILHKLSTAKLMVCWLFLLKKKYSDDLKYDPELSESRGNFICKHSIANTSLKVRRESWKESQNRYWNYIYLCLYTKTDFIPCSLFFSLVQVFGIFEPCFFIINKAIQMRINLKS